MRSVFLEHPSSFGHVTGSHPEQPARLRAIEDELSARDWLGFERVQSPPVAREVLTAVHPEAYVDRIEQLAAAGGGALDPDTVLSSGSFEAASHAAGGAVRLVDLLLDGDATSGFSAHRPPGHHATVSEAMGFCLFNSVAVAAQYAIDRRGLDRVMVLDWDVHHGNGTNDIFHASHHVLFISIHQMPLYPGTGAADDVGSGPGRGFTINLPVPPGSGDETFCSLVDHVAIPLLGASQPQLVLVSAGYDGHAEDPLADCRLTESGFAAMTLAVRDAAASAGAPVGCVLEGGYALGPLARSVSATMAALNGSPSDAEPGTAGTGPAAATPESDSARSRLAQWWPSLAA